MGEQSWSRRGATGLFVVLSGAIVGAIIGAIFGVIASNVGVGVGVVLGLIAGAGNSVFIWALFALRPNPQLLRALPGMSEEQAVEASARLSEVRAAPGEVIVREGDVADRFYIVSRGRVEVLQTQSGEEHRIALLGPGQFFGEIGLLAGGTRTATVRAMDEARLLTLDAKSFADYLGSMGGSKSVLERAARERLAAG